MATKSTQTDYVEAYREYRIASAEATRANKAAATARQRMLAAFGRRHKLPVASETLIHLPGGKCELIQPGQFIRRVDSNRKPYTVPAGIVTRIVVADE